MKNALLLIVSPLILFAIVFFLTNAQPKSFTSTTTIYTGIATGSSITSLEDSRLDLFGTRTAFDNLINIIKSRGTAEEAGLRLFTSHMMLEAPVAEIISKESYDKLLDIVPQEVKNLVVTGNYEKTYDAFLKYKNRNHTNFIYELIRLNHPHYSYEKILSKLKASRYQSSDMIELSYSSDDQGICFQTLQIITDVFIHSYEEIKVNQSDAVLRYFQGQLDNAQAKLDDAEKELLEFNKTNNIINYYEQTKHIASEKEQFDSEFQRIKMQHAAAESLFQVLESKLNSRQQKQLNNKNIIELRDQLVEINMEITINSLQSEGELVEKEALARELSDLRMKSSEIQQQLKNSIDEAYFIDNSTEGVASTSILQEWLETVMEYESTKAKLIAGEQRKREFTQLFSEFAPLGAMMKQLERKIDVAEREYLSILHSLNTARLKQQNVELNSNLKIAEPPFYPIKSQPDKRKYLLLIALIIGFIIPAFIILALDDLDQNIRNGKRMESASNLQVASSFPNLTIKNRRINNERIKEIAIDKMAQKFIILVNEIKEPKPLNFAIISNKKGEGKTTLAIALIKKLENLGYHALFLSYHQPENSSSPDFISYKADNHFQKVERVTELNAHLDPANLDYYDFVFVELPPIIQNIYPVNLIKNVHQILLTVSANRSWSEADNNAIHDLIKVTEGKKPVVLLNGVAIQELENDVGEIPEK